MHHPAPRSAKTSTSILAHHRDVWNKVGFYEHVNKQPGWLLRLSLPAPQEVDGQHNKAGDICRCRYSDGGFLTKRITAIEPGSRIDFEIIEQSIRYQDAIQLLGGYIEVDAIDEGQSMIHMVTYYHNLLTLETISSVFIDKVIKTMHRFVIDDMRAQLECRVTAAALA